MVLADISYARANDIVRMVLCTKCIWRLISANPSSKIEKSEASEIMTW